MNIIILEAKNIQINTIELKKQYQICEYKAQILYLFLHKNIYISKYSKIFMKPIENN